MTRPARRQAPQQTTRQAVQIAMTRAGWKAYCAEHGIDGRGGWTSRAHKYGMTPQALHAMYVRQNGRCYLCGLPFPANLSDVNAFAVDHDHACCPGSSSCGRCVRGLAHPRCNLLIAMADDDPARLRRMTGALEAAAEIVRQQREAAC